MSLRTLVPVGPTGGSFTGTITGGNGRAGVGPYQTYEFNVPAGHGSMSLNLQTSDSGDILEGVLVDPNGMQLSVQPNADVFGNQQFGMTLSHYAPQAGRWRFTLVTNFTVSGNETSLPFTGRVSFSQANGVEVKGLPNNPAKLLSASGKPVSVTVNVTNTGCGDFSVLCRLSAADAGPAAAAVLCMQRHQYAAESVRRVHPAHRGRHHPILCHGHRADQMDAENDVGINVAATGNPDIFAVPAGPTSVLATLSEPEVPWGAWLTFPSLIGPYGPAGAPTTPVVSTAFALMQPFDASMSPSTAIRGPIWCWAARRIVR